MKIQRAWKYKLKLNEVQEERLTSWHNIVRGLYNAALEQRIVNYRQFGKIHSYEDQANELPALKRECPWIADVPAQCLQQKLKDLHTAYNRFFVCGAGFPRFRKKGVRDSLRFPDAKQFRVDFRKGKRTSYVKLPKLGLVKFVCSRQVMGRIKNCTVSKAADGFYISFQSEYEKDVRQNPGPAIGIDRGVHHLAMTSDGQSLKLPVERIKDLEVRLKYEQKKLARKKKFSRNWNKQKIKVACIHQRIGGLRQDSLHKLTTSIAKSHGVVVVEDLRIKCMTRSAKGSKERPGKRVRQKAGLNRAILRQGWGEFERQLAYKLLWNGGELRKVPAPFTSQACHICAHVSAGNRKQEQFVCIRCGHEDHADINAAKNILALGHSATVCGEASFGTLAEPEVRYVSMKQKPISA